MCHQIEQIGCHMQARTYIRAMLEVFSEGRRCVRVRRRREGVSKS